MSMVQPLTRALFIASVALCLLFPLNAESQTSTLAPTAWSTTDPDHTTLEIATTLAPSAATSTLLTATPVFDIEDGAVFVISATIHATSSTIGATVYYDISGNYPDLNAAITEPEDPIILTEPGAYTVAAVARSPGLADSLVAQVSLSVLARTATPVIHVQGTAGSAPGEYWRGVNLTFESATPGAEVWYTTDGGVPEPGRAPAARAPADGGPVAWRRPGATTVRARAAAAGLADSAEGRVDLALALPPFDRVPRAGADADDFTGVRGFEVAVAREAAAAAEGGDGGEATVTVVRGVAAAGGALVFRPPLQGCAGPGQPLSALAAAAAPLAAAAGGGGGGEGGGGEGGGGGGCAAAVPAGPFVAEGGGCLGNLIHQGAAVAVATSPSAAVHLGVLLADGGEGGEEGGEEGEGGGGGGDFVVGRLAPGEAAAGPGGLGFRELVTGLGWLVRDGAAATAADLAAQEGLEDALVAAALALAPAAAAAAESAAAGGGAAAAAAARRAAFLSARLPRAAAGVDARGRAAVAATDGAGATLGEWAAALARLGLRQAVNLAGGTGAAAGLAAGGPGGGLVTPPLGACGAGEGEGEAQGGGGGWGPGGGALLRCEAAVGSAACLLGPAGAGAGAGATPAATAAPGAHQEGLDDSDGIAGGCPPAAGGGAGAPGGGGGGGASPPPATAPPSPTTGTGTGAGAGTAAAGAAGGGGGAPEEEEGAGGDEGAGDLALEGGGAAGQSGAELCLDMSTANSKLRMALGAAVFLLMLSLAGNITGHLRAGLQGKTGHGRYHRHRDDSFEDGGGAAGRRGLAGQLGDERTYYGGRPQDHKGSKKRRNPKQKMKAMFNTMQHKVTGAIHRNDGMREIDLEINPFEASSYSQIPNPMHTSDSHQSLSIPTVTPPVSQRKVVVAATKNNSASDNDDDSSSQTSEASIQL